MYSALSPFFPHPPSPPTHGALTIATINKQPFPLPQYFGISDLQTVDSVLTPQYEKVEMAAGELLPTKEPDFNG